MIRIAWKVFSYMINEPVHSMDAGVGIHRLFTVCIYIVSHLGL